MRTDELEGAALNYWVAKALGDREAHIVGAEEHERCEARFGSQWPWNRFSPSSAWMDGGPIIEREHINLEGRSRNGSPMNEWCAKTSGPRIYFGKSPLIAAMRAYVAMRFGDEVGAIPGSSD
jgi:hypothetical protein